MGTRADFYVRKDTGDMEWLGSIALDGNPAGIDTQVLDADREEAFKYQVAKFIEREDGTNPYMGWPWPWDDSRTTDYAYIFENGKVMASYFGGSLFDPLEPDDEEGESKLKNYFPDMKDVKNVTFGQRSGLIIFRG